jgi:hypothetical protein
MRKISKTSNGRLKRSPRRLGRVVPSEYPKYLALVLKLPCTEESTSYGTPAIKVKGKLLSRLRTEAEGALALRCDFLDRQILLQADSDSFFLTDHYRDYPWILVRLDKISTAALADVVLRAWRIVAPKKVVSGYHHDGARDTG